MKKRLLAFKILGIVSMLGGATVGHEGEVIDLAIDELEKLAERVSPGSREDWQQSVDETMAAIEGSSDG